MGASVKALSMSIDVPGGDMFAFMGATNDANSAAYAVENMGIRIVADFVGASPTSGHGVFPELMTESARNGFQPLAMTLENGGAWGLTRSRSGIQTDRPGSMSGPPWSAPRS